MATLPSSKSWDEMGGLAIVILFYAVLFYFALCSFFCNTLPFFSFLFCTFPSLYMCHLCKITLICSVICPSEKSGWFITVHAICLLVIYTTYEHKYLANLSMTSNCGNNLHEVTLYPSNCGKPWEPALYFDPNCEWCTR